MWFLLAGDPFSVAKRAGRKKQPAFRGRRVGLCFVPSLAVARPPLRSVRTCKVSRGPRAMIGRPTRPRTYQPKSIGPRAPPHASMHGSTGAPPFAKVGTGFAAGSELLIGSLRGCFASRGQRQATGERIRQDPAAKTVPLPS